MIARRPIQTRSRLAVAMRRVRALSVLGAVTALMATLGVVTLTVGPAGAKTPTGTGTFRCGTTNGGVSVGGVSFSPAWSDTGTGIVHATVNMTINECSGGSPAPTSVTVTGKLKFPNGNTSCSLGVHSLTAKLKLSYFPMVKKSKLISSNFIFYRDDTLGAEVFTSEYPFVVTGSYPVTASSGPAFFNGFGYPGMTCKSGITSLPLLGFEFWEA